MQLQLAKVIGHRGACGYAPENTLTAMTKAQELGVKWVEFDVKLTKCGELIIFHDDDLARTTNGNGLVAQHDLMTMGQLDCGSWFSEQYVGEKIPTFKELLSHVSNLQLSINIEIKPCSGRELATTLQTIQDVVAHWPPSAPAPLISSFSTVALEAASQWHFPLGYLIENWDPKWEDVVERCHCVALHVNQTQLTEERVNYVKSKGLLLLAYTVNEPQRAKQLFSWGVDSVFSDYPDQIAAAVED